MTACIARKGLQTWNRQLRGTASFDAAKTLATATYKLRGEIGRCRSITIQSSNGDFYSPDGDGWAKLARHNVPDLRLRYDDALTKVKAAFTEVETAALVAEALWGDDIRVAVGELRTVQQLLTVNVGAYLGTLNHEVLPTTINEIRDVVGVTQDVTLPSAFTALVHDAVSSVERIVGPHLKR